MGIIYLDEKLLETMCHGLAVDLFDSINEPIGEFRNHDIGLLNSALNQPKQAFDGKDLYEGLAKKAVILYYSLNKNHAFENGNKRISTAALIVFIYINDRRLWVNPNDLLQKTLEIAKSKPEERELILKETEEWLDKNIITIEEWENRIKSVHK